MNAARRDAITEATLMDRFSDNMSQFVDWIDARFPMTKMLKEHATEYYAAKNFNVLYVFGVLAMVVLIGAAGHRYLPYHELQARC